MENIEELLQCECGSVFFDEIRARTYIENQFIFHASTPSAKLSNEDITIPVAKCLFCGKVYLPRTSFAGRNTLDRAVQVYAELTNQWVKSNMQKILPILNSTGKDDISKVVTDVHIEVSNVETESSSGTDTKDVVQKSGQRNRSVKNNKK